MKKLKERLELKSLEFQHVSRIQKNNGSVAQLLNIRLEKSEGNNSNQGLLFAGCTKVFGTGNVHYGSLLIENPFKIEPVLDLTNLGSSTGSIHIARQWKDNLIFAIDSGKFFSCKIKSLNGPFVALDNKAVVSNSASDRSLSCSKMMEIHQDKLVYLHKEPSGQIRSLSIIDLLAADSELSSLSTLKMEIKYSADDLVDFTIHNEMLFLLKENSILMAPFKNLKLDPVQFSKSLIPVEKVDQFLQAGPPDSVLTLVVPIGKNIYFVSSDFNNFPRVYFQRVGFHPQGILQEPSPLVLPDTKTAVVFGIGLHLGKIGAVLLMARRMQIYLVAELKGIPLLLANEIINGNRTFSTLLLPYRGKGKASNWQILLAAEGCLVRKINLL